MARGGGASAAEVAGPWTANATTPGVGRVSQPQVQGARRRGGWAWGAAAEAAGAEDRDPWAAWCGAWPKPGCAGALGPAASTRAAPVAAAAERPGGQGATAASRYTPITTRPRHPRSATIGSRGPLTRAHGTGRAGSRQPCSEPIERVKVRLVESLEQPVRRGRMAERRERILAAARDLIAARGIEALTMRELARASRVTVPTVYNLVGGRDRVLLEAVREQTARFVAGIAAAPEAAPVERVLSVADSCTGELLRRPAYYRPLLAWIFTAEGAAEVQREVGAALSRELGKALTAMESEGLLASWADSDVLRLRIAAHLGMASLQWASGELDDDAFHAVARLETSLALLGLVRGKARATLEAAARKAQARLAGPQPRGRRASGARR